ncbi:MAG: molybdenum cofactor guanylyltransferase [Ignavibacteriae bacterium]|nr:MAG: molybdenum cofactor guanylyltransferase [Ignavibacteriota bacterium]
MYKDVTGIILSGGKSSRMGRNKSLLTIGDLTIIERVRDLMKSLFNKVILITNDPADYKFLNIPIFEDLFKHKGPLAGIHSGLTHSSSEKNFIISCDIPFINPEMIKYIVDFKTEKLITIAKADGYIQQLAGKYSMDCLNTAEEILEEYVNLENRNNNQVRRRCNVLKLIDKVGAEIISAESLTFYKKELFFNMNKVEDYNLLLEKLSLVDQNQN